MDYPKIRVDEGAASFLVPELDESTAGHIDRARSLAPVFYNPRMRLNRDSAVLALGVHQGRLGRSVSACEPMCGTGIRGVRLALEVDGIEEIVLSDLNSKAVQLAIENISINGVSDRVAVRHMEANLLLALHAKPLSRFDYVDIDPYGTPAPYLDTAVRACKRGGLIGLTATDMAPLCGVNPRACLRKYGGRSLRTDYCHELAIRLVVGAMAVTAARHEVASAPVFSYAADHYVRVYAHLERGKKKADGSLREMGYVLHCFSCGHRRTVPLFSLKEVGCEVCGSEMKAAGPMWVGELADASFCDDMLCLSERSYAGSNRRLTSIITEVRDEVGLPVGFFNVDRACSEVGMASVDLAEAMNALRVKGFRATVSHIDNRGIKTDASASDVVAAFRELKERGGA
jgi:tRNA (guanine26-N2/guanine27-N2)-dimethyltransferase